MSHLVLRNQREHLERSDMETERVSHRRDDRGEDKERASQDKAGGRELRSWLTMLDTPS